MTRLRCDLRPGVRSWIARPFQQRVAQAALCGLLTGGYALAGCTESSPQQSAASSVPSGGPSSALEANGATASNGSSDATSTSAAGEPGLVLGAKGLHVVIRDRPKKKGARKFGYLRLGGTISRESKPAGSEDCPAHWYAVRPRGFACVDEDATIDPDDPVLRAASRRPDLSKPMPYAYGFVRSVTPMYLRVPTKDEQLEAEFKLEQHLEWWKNKGHRFNEVTARWANDVAVDRLSEQEQQEQGLEHAADMSQGELFGGQTDADAAPWWLRDGRKIQNVSGFDVPKAAAFADRARRFTGLAFVGSFPTGEESLNRRFAITEDLRLVPTTKIKPDGGPSFHGVELGEERKLPLAWIRKEDAKLYAIKKDKLKPLDEKPGFRSIVKLTGKERSIGRKRYVELEGGHWIRGKSLGIAAEPKEKPKAAKRGEKWIDIAILQQVLVLWEGDRPVYATLVSTGQDKMGDPKTTKSTVRGTFRILNKHITRTMDSDEGLSRDSGDDEYGKSKRRGQGSYRLDHVPWVQYFKGSYALHATHWHDVFGTARSHGCINMAPVDAHRVFFWTEPQVPEGWHGVYANDEHRGTVVFIHE